MEPIGASPYVLNENFTFFGVFENILIVLNYIRSLKVICLDNRQDVGKFCLLPFDNPLREGSILSMNV